MSSCVVCADAVLQISVFVVVEVLPILYGFRTSALSSLVEKKMFPEKADEAANPVSDRALDLAPLVHTLR